MGVFDFFRKKEQKRTAGGSLLIESSWKKTEEMMGVPDKDTRPLMSAREKVYDEFFGDCETVHHEIIRMIPHIDVYIHAPNESLNRPFYTLVTGGMSDFRMTLPDEIADDFGRREIVAYTKTLDLQVISLMRCYARFPFQASTWLGEGHTIPNGDPPEPLFENSELAGVLFLRTPIEPDIEMSEHLSLEGDPVELLWMFPVTQAEMDYKLEFGTDALIDKFQEIEEIIVLDPLRKSCV